VWPERLLLSQAAICGRRRERQNLAAAASWAFLAVRLRHVERQILPEGGIQRLPNRHRSATESGRRLSAAMH